MTGDERVALWYRDAKSFAFGGHQVRYVEAGSGAWVVCVHGWPTSSFDYHRLWPLLEGRAHLLAPDLLGCGHSDKPWPHAYSISASAELVEALLRARGADEVHLVAHDYGVSVGQELLARELEGRLGFRIRSMCFLNGGLFPEAYRPRPIQRILSTRLGPFTMRLVTRGLFGRLFSGVFGPDTRPPGEDLDAFWESIHHNGGIRIQHALCRQMLSRWTERDRWVGALQRTRVPLRLIDGCVDPNSGRHMAARYSEVVPNPDVVLLEHIGHYPHYEAPAATAEALWAFVRAHSALNA